jgi:predicted permease
VARLAPGVSLGAANNALDIVAAQLREEYPDENRRMGLIAFPESRSAINGAAVGVLRVIEMAALGIGVLVLLVACANVSGLLLARAVGRRHEIGVRFAMGAGSGRIARLLFTESLLLAILGGAAGLGVAWLASRAMLSMTPRLPYRLALDLSPDGSVVLAAGAVAVLAAVVLGLAPTVHTLRRGPTESLSHRAIEVGRGGGRLLNTIVVGMVSMSFVTLVVGGLFARSLGTVRSTDPGLALDHRLVATIDPGLAGSYETREQHAEFLRQVQLRLEALPGVERAGLTSNLPLGDRSSSSRLYADERTYESDHPGEETWMASVSSSYLAVAGVPILAGRGLTDGDGAPDAARGIVINETLAEALWPGEDPVGRRVRFSPEPGETAGPLVIGVVPAARYIFMGERPRAAAYSHIYRTPALQSEIVLRTRGEPKAMTAELLAAVAAVDPDVPVFQVRDMRDHMAYAEWLFRMGASIGAVLGGLALLLAAGGLYGVVAFAVGRRKREMGLRMALGAQRGRVLRMVMLGSARVTVVGIVLGLILAVIGGGGLSTLLVGVGGRDPVTLVLVGTVLLAIGALASLGPARAATRVDPAETLREE